MSGGFPDDKEVISPRGGKNSRNQVAPPPNNFCLSFSLLHILKLFGKETCDICSSPSLFFPDNNFPHPEVSVRQNPQVCPFAPFNFGLLDDPQMLLQRETTFIHFPSLSSLSFLKAQFRHGARSRENGVCLPEMQREKRWTQEELYHLLGLLHQCAG